MWRAGRKGAKTDHSAVLFDIDPSGKFKEGTTNSHWYQLGLGNCLRTKWRTAHDISRHPDNGVIIAGEAVDATSIMKFATSAHEKMMPRIPIVGWDVALTENGMLMLECNLSCNFFCGAFDQNAYFSFVEEYLVSLENS